MVFHAEVSKAMVCDQDHLIHGEASRAVDSVAYVHGLVLNCCTRSATTTTEPELEPAITYYRITRSPPNAHAEEHEVKQFHLALDEAKQQITWGQETT